MSKLVTLFKIVTKDPSKLFFALGKNGFLQWMQDAIFLKILYRINMGSKLNLNNPTTFNEKIQWLKIHDNRPEYKEYVDKLAAKKIIGQIIGEEHIVPTIQVWDEAESIDFSNLPNQIVLKCNHDQGSVMIIDDIEHVNREEVISFYRKCLRSSPFAGTREHPYKGIRPKVFAEKYLGKSIVDYKFYCFNGEPKFLYCGKGLTIDHSLKIDFFDMNWNLMPFYRTDYKRLGMIDIPKKFEEMKIIARKLSAGIPFVRIDLFEIDDTVYFSEFTLYPASGFAPFVPEEYDSIIGSWLSLPQ